MPTAVADLIKLQDRHYEKEVGRLSQQLVPSETGIVDLLRPHRVANAVAQRTRITPGEFLQLDGRGKFYWLSKAIGGESGDPAAYRPAKDILEQFAENECFSNFPSLKRFVERHGVSSQQPLSAKTGKPHQRRRNIHVGELLAAMKLCAEAESKASDEAQAKALIDAMKTDEGAKY